MKPGGAHGFAASDSRRSWRLHVMIAIAAVFLAAANARADVSVRATLDTQQAQVGQPVTLSIEVQGAQNVESPTLTGLEDFDAQYIGPSTQVSIINGQMRSSATHRYALTPRREGRFNLGPFTVKFDDQEYRTQPLQLNVGKAPPIPQAPAAGQGEGSQQVRLVATVPKTEVYLHEVLPLDVTLYVGNIQVADVQYPTVTAEGMSLDQFGRPRQFGQMIEGRRWDAVQFHTTIIPLQEGARSLGPVILRLNLVERGRQGGTFNDTLFNAFGARRRSAEVHAEPVQLTVLPLPQEGKPPSFSGAVGNFNMQVSASPTEVTAGDPITVKIVIRGEGNLADARPPAPISVEGFKAYDAQVTQPEGDALRVFEQVLVPNEATVTSIPPVRFAYFDPAERTYKTIESAPIALAVRPAQPGQETRILAAEGERRVTREELGRDIVYIKDDLGALRPRSSPWYGGWLFLLWQPIPALLFIAAIFYDRRRQRLTGDVRYARFTQARRNARRGLALAEEALKHADPGAFYDQLSRTVQSYLSDKLGLPPGAIYTATAGDWGITHEIAQRLRHLFEACEQVRFAPTSADGDMRGVLSAAEDIIKRLEKECVRVPTAGKARP
jgi:hypothetical protein